MKSIRDERIMENAVPENFTYQHNIPTKSF